MGDLENATKTTSTMKTKFVGAMLMVFSAGFVCAMNLSRLLPTNPSYEANWFKVGFTLFLAVVFATFAFREAGRIQRRRAERQPQAA